MITATAPTMNSKTLLTRENTPDSPNKVVGWWRRLERLAADVGGRAGGGLRGASAAATMLIEAKIPMMILLRFIIILNPSNY